MIPACYCSGVSNAINEDAGLRRTADAVTAMPVGGLIEKVGNSAPFPISSLLSGEEITA